MIDQTGLYTPPEPEQCPAVGALVVGGRQVGWLRCSLELGHEQPRQFGIPHRQVFEWTDDEAIDWPEAYDPDETFDVDIPFEPTLEDTQPASAEVEPDEVEWPVDIDAAARIKAGGWPTPCPACGQVDGKHVDGCPVPVGGWHGGTAPHFRCDCPWCTGTSQG